MSSDRRQQCHLSADPSSTGEMNDDGSTNNTATRRSTYNFYATPVPKYLSERIDFERDDPAERIRAWSAMLPRENSCSPSDLQIQTETQSLMSDTISTVLSSSHSSQNLDIRYVYYRVYTEESGITSKNAVDASDPSLARIKSRSVAPPHTVSSLIRCLCRSENIGDYTRASLFASSLSQFPMADESRITILTNTGPGSSPQEPLSLVVRLWQPNPSIDVARSLALLPYIQTSAEPKYVYYRTFSETGEIASKRPIDPNEPSLSRINANFIPPPYTAASIKRTLCKLEDLLSPGLTKLFLSLSSEDHLADEDFVSNLTDMRPKAVATLEEPLIFMTLPQVDLPANLNKVLFYKRIICTNDIRGNSVWLPMSKDEILYTDGVERRLESKNGKSRRFYLAQNVFGIKGAVYPYYVRILHD